MPSNAATRVRRPMPHSSSSTDVLVVGLGPVGAALGRSARPLRRTRAGDRQVHRDLHEAARHRAGQRGLAHPAAGRRSRRRVLDGRDPAGAVPLAAVRAVRPHQHGRHHRWPPGARHLLPARARTTAARESWRSAERRRCGRASSWRGFVDDGTRVQARLKDAEGGAGRCARASWSAPTARTRSCGACSGWTSKAETFAQDWLIVDALDVPNPIDHVEFICDPRRPTPHMVAPGGRQRWEFMLRPGEIARGTWSGRSRCAVCLRPGAMSTHPHRAHRGVPLPRPRGGCSRRAAVFSPGTPRTSRRRSPARDSWPACAMSPTSRWKLAWVVRGQADAPILDSYDAERRPHARKIIKLARFLGALVMPSNRARASSCTA